jgi:hypothetical protein
LVQRESGFFHQLDFDDGFVPLKPYFHEQLAEWARRPDSATSSIQSLDKIVRDHGFRPRNPRRRASEHVALLSALVVERRIDELGFDSARHRSTPR